MITTAQFSIAEYDRIAASGALHGRRLELLTGRICEMSPIGPIHENIVDLLAEWSFQSAVPQLRVRVQQSIELPNSQSAPEPDIVWAVRKSYRSGRPNPEEILLTIEVANNSLNFDLGQKADMYAATGIADYWVVDVTARQLISHRNPQATGYGSVERIDATRKIASLSVLHAELERALCSPDEQQDVR